jgi:hypothetical protein
MIEKEYVFPIVFPLFLTGYYHNETWKEDVSFLKAMKN